jgi:phage host-nuclease inhibitor protein Gam
MSKKRLKLPAVPAIKDRVAAETAVNEITSTMLNKRKLEAQRDGHLLDVENRYHSLLTDCDNFIAPRLSALQAWADAHPGEFPKGRKSIDLANGSLGYRTGTPKLKLLKKLTLKQLLERLKTLGLTRYMRQIWEVNKDALIADRDKDPFGLKNLGVEVVQEETFYVEPKLSDAEKRVSAPAAEERQAA